MQVMQDRNALASAPAAMVQRSVAKASAGYSNEYWDLVDAKKEKKVSVAEMKADELPEEMKKMSPQEREAYVEKKAAERAELQEKISKLNAERRTYVALEQKKVSADNTLDKAVIDAVRKVAVKKGYSFDSK
jgi:hypothetical protein